MTWQDAVLALAGCVWIAVVTNVAIHHARKRQYGQMMVACVIMAPTVGYVLLTLTAAVFR